MNLQTTEVNTRTRTATFSAKELAEVLAQYVAAEMGDVRITWPGVTYKVSFEDETEGSPSYKVGTKATVQIIEDRNPQAVEEKA